MGPQLRAFNSRMSTEPDGRTTEPSSHDVRGSYDDGHQTAMAVLRFQISEGEVIRNWRKVPSGETTSTSEI
jgi:hypothetical protein